MEEVGKDLSRRDALKLAAGAAALGAALGVPRSLLASSARGEPAGEFYFKFFYSGKLWNSIQLTDEQVKQLAEGPGNASLKLFRGAEQLAAQGLGPEVQIKLRALDIKRTR